MSSKVESTMGDDEDFGSGLLLRDIEEISKALYLHKNPPKAFISSSDHHVSVATKTGHLESKSKVIIQDSSHKDKKSSIWNWKPLKALAHIRNHRFNCCFFLHVHAIEGLPSSFNNLKLRVTWKRKGEMLQTHPATVSVGMAEFEETLMHQCTVYASRSGHQNLAKYEPKLFLLHTFVIGAPTLDIGKHWIDLTRLLPLTLDELEGGNRSSGKWTTSFKLTSKAEGAMLNVSFGFSILDGNSFDHFADFGNSRIGQLDHYGAVPTVSAQGSYNQSQSTDIQFLDEIVRKRGLELGQSITLLYQKLDEGNMDNAIEFDFSHEPLESLKLKSGHLPESAGGNSGHECSDTEFSLIERGVEVSVKGQLRIAQQGIQRFDSSLIETINVEEIFREEEMDLDVNFDRNSKLDTNDHAKNESVTDDTKFDYDNRSIKEPTSEELDSVFSNMFPSRSMELDSLRDMNEFYEQENCTKTEFSLDDIAESIENDFLNMLSIEETPPDNIVSNSGSESPRDRLLRQFEEEAFAWENPIRDTEFMTEQNGCEDDFDLSFTNQAVEMNHGSSLMQSIRTRRNVKMLENLETKSLMDEWGLNENAFRNSPHISSSGFGSPVYVPTEEPLKLPSLEEGLGPIIRVRDGGFLRSMNPLLFRNANNGARLIMQVSGPVVLPAVMGFTTMEILQHWASEGVKKMFIQAKELMPLEDITGKTMQQVVSEAKSGLKSFVEGSFVQNFDSFCSCSTFDDVESEYVNLENLVPMAITDIEGLLIEGLKIQSGMQDKEAPSSIRIQFSWNPTSLGKNDELSRNFGSERDSSVQVGDVGELVKYSLSLEEWTKLDSGDFDAKGQTDDDILKVLAAHCAKSVDLSNGQVIREEDDRVELLGRNCGIFGNNFTIALRLQLRDPLRNNEMVGSSMLALIQVERVYSPSQQPNHVIGIPQFKVLEVHLAGLNTNKQLWSTSRQHQSGSRWLLSSGITRTKGHPISNSNAIIKPSLSKTWEEDILWSISSHTQGEAASWDELVALNVHVRNPDIIFPKESS